MTKKILGIGNAIVDILCKTEDKFLQEKNLIKGSMSLIDEISAQEFSQLKSEKITSGGSASNTISALAQLGCKTAFIGKVGRDEFGKKFISEIEKTGCEFVTTSNHDLPSAKSFIFVSPDAQRTMCTFLGCAGKISENDIEEKSLQSTSILYLEGYLWDAPETILALKKAINLAKKNGAKIAFSLSDVFCVARHKEDFLQLIENDLDILFANEHEAAELIGNENFGEFFATKKNLITAITRSSKGCSIFAEGKSFDLPAEKIEKLIDTTGAGDAFAAGFLHGITSDQDLQNCAKLGNILASKIIQQFGARFEKITL